MEWYNIVLRIIELTIWPLILLIIFLFLKDSISRWIDKIKEIKHGNFSVTTNLQDNSNIKEVIVSNNNKVLHLFDADTINFEKEIILKNINLKEINNDHDKINVLMDYTVIISLLRGFENIYSSIYGSQISILQFLNSNTNSTKENLLSFYDSAVKAYPNIYNNYSFENYLDYLFRSGTIINQNGFINITIYGRDFLKYLTQAGKTPYKAG